LSFAVVSPAPISLPAWLVRLEQLHPKEIDMGLDRVVEVRDRMGLQPSFPIISVGGTNGKGSTCAMLEAVYKCAGYKAGLYTSPHLVSYNERVRVNGQEVKDEELVGAFERIDAARGEIPLTYFEFGTLAAQLIFCDDQVDVAILEVGLGGRLDAVNAFEPDCSVVLNVAIDHVDFLGASRELIGLEKAGIFRRGKPAICAEEEPPASVLDYASSTGAELHLAGRDFGHTRTAMGWQFWNAAGKKTGLPFPLLRGSAQLYNAAAAFECVHAMRAHFPVDMAALRGGLLNAYLPGRFQVLPGAPLIILDVAHNAAAAQVLSADLKALPCSGKTIAVFGVLADKQIEQITSALASSVDEWFVCGLRTSRGSDAESVKQLLMRSVQKKPVSAWGSVAQGCAAAQEVARGNDRILVFGSFYTVSEALETIGQRLTASRENGESD
jgi:dihydrofolate synthase/folylpolyglutamate synthase